MRARALLLAAMIGACGGACGGAGGGPAVVAPPVQPSAPPAATIAPPKPVEVTADQLHGVIRSFAITGGEDVDYLRLQPLFNDEVGKPLDRERLRAKLDQAMAPQTLANLELRGEQLADGIRLGIRVTPQPKVVAVAMRDGAGKPVPTPPALAGMQGARLAPAELDALVTALRDQWTAEGRMGTAARWTTTPTAGGVTLTLDASEGIVIVIAARTYQGAVHATAADLDRALEVPLVGAVWNPERIERDLLLVQAYYWDHGYAQVSVHLGPVPTGNPATVTFDITEGPIFHLGRLEVTGVGPADAKRLLALMKLKAGALFSRAQIATARDLATQTLVGEGHPKASVMPLTTVDPVKHTIALSFQVALDG